MNHNYFFFEEQEYDIPFYRKTPRMTRSNLLILLLGLIIASITPFVIPINGHHIFKAVIMTLSTLIPLVYTLKGNLNMIFRIPKRNDVITIVLGVLFYMALSILVSSILSAAGIITPSDNAIASDFAVSVVSMIIQILGEELLKLIAFIVVMYYAYKHTNRKNAIIISIMASQLLFTLIHIPAYGLNIAHLLISIGVVSSILPIIYLRTKNIIVTYLTHLLIDLIPIILATIVTATLI